MSVMYRALWTDDSQQDPFAYIDEVRGKFTSWALEDNDADPLPDGATEVQLRMNRTRAITVRTIEAESATEPDQESRSLVGMEAITQDSATDGDARGTVWTTVTRVVTDGSAIHVWVENRVESDDVSVRVTVGRPRMVDDLLTIVGKPHLAGSGLLTEVQPISAELVPVLVELLQSETRALPVIVCTEPAGDHDARWSSWAERIARRAGGIAIVATLDSAAVTAFRRTLGDLAVWGGGVRVYVPGNVLDASDGWRHRYTLGHLMSSREDAMVDRIVYSVAQMSARRRVPDEFLGFTTTAPAEATSSVLVGFVSEEDAERERIHWERLLEEQVAETNSVEQDLAQKIGHLDRLRAALEGQQLHDLFWGTAHDTSSDIPDEVHDTSDAILAAQTYLSDRVVVHDGAPRNLDGIDTCPQAFSWGNKTWRGLRALAAYAEARSSGFKGGFWEWCKEGGPFAWPANSKASFDDRVDQRAKQRQTESVTCSARVDKCRSVGRDHHVEPPQDFRGWRRPRPSRLLL